MASSSSSSQKQHAFLLLSLSLLSLASTSSAANILNIHNQLVSRICDHTDHPPLCLATVLPLLAGGGQVDLKGVLKYAVEAGGKYAKEALAAVKNLSDSKDATPEVKSTLKDCQNSYSTAVDNFGKTMDAMATNDVGTMRSVLSAVITFVADCEDEFTQMQTPSPMSAYAEKLTDMTSNCLAIVAQLHS